MSQNPFFQRNTISAFPAFKQKGVAKIRAKRATSVTNIKTNIQKFQHRQVFDSKIYQKVNFFRLGLQQLKQEHQKKQLTSLRQLQAVLGQLSETTSQKYFANFALNYNNHWNLLKSETDKQSEQIITRMLIQLFQKTLKTFNVLLKNQNELLQKMSRLNMDLKVANKQDFSIIQKTEAKGADMREHNLKLRKQKQRVMQLDFELKKEMLKVDALEQKIRQKDKLITNLTKENQEMLHEKEQQSSFKQTMQHKIKQLKEELNVAQILKEQSLEDKMKYIMNW